MSSDRTASPSDQDKNVTPDEPIVEQWFEVTAVVRLLAPSEEFAMELVGHRIQTPTVLGIGGPRDVTCRPCADPFAPLRAEWAVAEAVALGKERQP